MDRASFSRSRVSMLLLISFTSTMSLSLMLKTKSFCLSGKRFWITSKAEMSLAETMRMSSTTRVTSVLKCSSRALT